MKNLNEIIQELDERRLPGDIAEIGEYIVQMNSLGISATSRIAMLIAHSRQTFFKEESGFHKWARESFNFKPNHTSHCAAIGRILLKVKPDSFHKLACLPFNKLLPVSRLEPDQVDSLLSSKDISAMTREQLRDTVREELHEDGKASKSSSQEEKETAKALEAIKLLAELNLETLSGISKSADAETIKAILMAGQKMLGAGVDAAAAKGVDGAAILTASERILSIQHKDVKKRLDALKASNPQPQLEAKTA